MKRFAVRRMVFVLCCLIFVQSCIYNGLVYAADYDTSSNVLCNAKEIIISKDSNATNPDQLEEVKKALVDGIRESASGSGTTKWFIQYPGNYDYVQFELPKEEAVYQLNIYSKVGVADTVSPISDFILQKSSDGATWENVITVTDNKDILCSVQFDVVVAKYFRIVENSKNQFRITEIELTRAYNRVGFEKEFDGNDIYFSQKLQNVFYEDSHSDLDSYLIYKVNGIVYEAEKMSNDTWRLQQDVEQRKDGYFIEVSLLSRKYDIVIYTFSKKLNVYLYEEFLRNINNLCSYEDFYRTFVDNEAIFFDKFGYDINILLGDSIAAKTEIYTVILSEAPYELNEHSIGTIVQLIHEKMPLISMNSANTYTEMEYSFQHYAQYFGIDVSIMEGLGPFGKSVFFDSIIFYRDHHGDFTGSEDINDAVLYALAYSSYKRANALTLLKVFQEFSDVYPIDVSFIEPKYLHETLFQLKRMDVNSYEDIPNKLNIAYEKAKDYVNNLEKDSASKGNQEPKVTYRYSINDLSNKEVTVKYDVFSDLGEYTWAKDAIEGLYALGIISGTGDGRFEPKRNVTREEFVKMLVEAFEISDSSSETVNFEDVTENAWYAPYVSAAYHAGIIKGYENGNFGVGDSITREDMIVMLYKAATISGIVFQDHYTDTAPGEFDDSSLISEYAVKAVEMMKNNNILWEMENNLFLPAEPANRALAAYVIYNVLERRGGNGAEK